MIPGTTGPHGSSRTPAPWMARARRPAYAWLWALWPYLALSAVWMTAAALFTPLRRRVQRAVDRRFNRARHDADQAVARFSARLQDAVDLGAVHGDLLAAVSAPLQPTHLSVRLRERDP